MAERKEKNINKIVYKKSRRFQVTVNDMYRWFKDHKWDKEKSKRITQKQYKIFISAFFRQIAYKIVIEKFTFIMPWKLGSFFVRKVKRRKNKRTYDWGRFKREGIKAYYPNQHTFGFRFCFIWGKDLASFRNQGPYHFLPTRSMKKLLYEEIIDRSEDLNKKSYNSH